MKLCRGRAWAALLIGAGILSAGMAGLAASPPANQTAAAVLPAITVRTGDHDGFSRIVFDWNKPIEYRVDIAGGTVLVAFPVAVRLDQARRDAPAKYIERVLSRHDGEGTHVLLTVAPNSEVRHFFTEGKVVVDIYANKPPAALDTKRPRARPTLPAALDDTEPAEPKPAAAAARLTATPPAPNAPPPVTAASPPAAAPQPATAPQPAVGVPLKVTVSAGKDGPVLGFAWPQPVAAAVFRRAGYLWVVFDRPATLDLSSLLDARPLIEGAGVIANPAATLLRIRVAADLTPVVLRDGDTWSLALKIDSGGGAPSGIEPQRQIQTADGPRIRLAATEPALPIVVEDPEVGDRIAIVPLPSVGQGVARRFDFAQFALLQTSQGLAVMPHVEGVALLRDREGIALTVDRGLLLSTGNGIADMRRSMLLRYDDWRRGGGEQFTDNRQALQAAVTAAAPAGRNEPRLELARFLFAHGFNADALSVMARLADADPAVERDAGFRLMRGAARLELSHLRDAKADLTNATLDNSAEGTLWRGRLAGLQEDWMRAGQDLAAGRDVMQQYPADVRARFRLVMANALIDAEDATSANAELMALATDRPGKALAAEALLMYARIAALQGRTVESDKAFKQAAEAGDRKVRAEAEIARADVELKRNDITAAQAIERLEGLRFAWRGDGIEAGLLRRLGELYLSVGDHRNGLATLRQAVTYFPNEPQTPAVAKQLSDAFSDLYLNGGAEKITPLTALGLYYDFRELSPTGAKGDEMIRRLADRLAAVDLLDRAGELLDHQVTYRLQGEEKARVGARLAVVNLLDKKPQGALDALRKTEQATLPAGLQIERRLLEARAQSDLGKFPAALAALDGQVGRDVDLLRSEINWRAKDWAGAAKALDTALADRWRDSRPLDGAERKQVLQLGVSLALANDRPGLDQLRERYAPRFDGTVEADAFGVVTERLERDGPEVRRLSTAIAQVGQLEAFMTSYRDKLAKGALSTIN